MAVKRDYFQNRRSNSKQCQSATGKITQVFTRTVWQKKYGGGKKRLRKNNLFGESSDNFLCLAPFVFPTFYFLSPKPPLSFIILVKFTLFLLPSIFSTTFILSSLALLTCTLKYTVYTSAEE